MQHRFLSTVHRVNNPNKNGIRTVLTLVRGGTNETVLLCQLSVGGVPHYKPTAQNRGFVRF